MCIFLVYCRFRFNNNYLTTPYMTLFSVLEDHSNVHENKRALRFKGCINATYCINVTYRASNVLLAQLNGGLKCVFSVFSACRKDRKDMFWPTVQLRQ